MSSAAKFWPRALLKLGAKKDATPTFTPTTDIAARIVGVAGAKQAVPAPAAPDITSFDAVAVGAAQLPPPPEPDADDDFSRQAERFVPDKSATTLTDRRGKLLRARIINVSSTGVAVEADFRIMPADSVAMVGAKPVHLGRSIRGGQVFVFEKPLDPSRCNRQIVL